MRVWVERVSCDTLPKVRSHLFLYAAVMLEACSAALPINRKTVTIVVAKIRMEITMVVEQYDGGSKNTDENDDVVSGKTQLKTTMAVVKKTLQMARKGKKKRDILTREKSGSKDE